MKITAEILRYLCGEKQSKSYYLPASIHIMTYTVCPTRCRTQHFFNNSNKNEGIENKFEQEYVCCVRNEKECVPIPLQISLQYPH